MVTLKELAEKSGVSIATVSNILNGKSNVSERTRARVLSIIEETGYTPNYMARGLRAASTRTIGVIADDISEFSTPKIINGIMEVLEENGYRTILANLRFYTKWERSNKTSEDYKKAIKSAADEFTSIKTDGIIYVSGHARNISEIPDDLSLPVVVAYAFTSRAGTPFIVFDDESAAFEMTEHLISAGSNRIGVITGMDDNIHTQKRLDGCKKAMQAHALQLDSRLIAAGDWSMQSGYDGCRKLLSEDAHLPAIFCLNDIMAAGAYKYLAEIGKVPGRDISVAGFDNRDISACLNPPLTTMEIPLTAIGEASARTMLNLIESGSRADEKIRLPCRLIARQSVIKK